VEITKATLIAAGTTEPNPYGRHSAPLPAYCRVEGSSIAASVWAAKSLDQLCPGDADHWNSDFLCKAEAAEMALYYHRSAWLLREIRPDSCAASPSSVPILAIKVMEALLISVS
jgi:hypothetical protein